MKLSRGWQFSLRKSLQQKESSLFWLELVPYLTGADMSADMYFALSSKGSSKNWQLTLIMSCVISQGTPWFITCNHQGWENKRLESN